MIGLERLQMLMHGFFGTGTVTANTSEGGGLQKMQINLHGAGSAVSDPIPSLQVVGFASSPMPGAHVVVIHMGGDRSKPIIIATDDPRHRPTDLAPGESKLYGASGAFIHIDAAGAITITPNGSPVTINGDLHVTGAIVGGFGGADQVTMATHTHPTPAGQSSAPTAGT